MFSTIFFHELSYWFKKPVFYSYMALFFTAAVFIAAVNAGIFDDVTATTGSSVIVNSPVMITKMFMGISSMILFLLPSIVGVSIYRDYKSEMHTILYSYPFSKANFLFAKFLSGLTVVAIIVLMVGIGLVIGFRLPGTNPLIVNAFDILVYLQTYLVFLLPNILFYGAVVFAVVAFSRNIAAGFITIIILMIIKGSMEVLLIDPENMFLGALLNPLGESTVDFITRYWTVAENNSLMIPIKGIVIYNRLLWLTVSTLIFGFVYKYFTFSQNALSFSFKKQTGERVTKRNFGGISKVKLPDVDFKFAFVQHLKITWKLSNIDFKYIIKSVPFIAIFLVGMIMIIVEYSESSNYQGTPEYPVTWKMMNFSEGYFLAIQICSFLYLGMLIHRAKIAGINQLLDTTPVPNWTLMLSKLLALFKMQMLMLALAMIAGLGFQIYKGYYLFEIELYLVGLFLLNSTYFIIWGMLTMFVQTVFKNQYLGLIVLIALLLSIPLSSLVGIDQAIYKYGQGLGFRYSDMNGYGRYITSHLLYTSYWMMAGIVLLLLASLFTVRGLPQSFKEHFTIARSRFKGATMISTFVLLVCFFTLGFTIYYENNIKNIPTSGKQRELSQVAWEKMYKKYDKYVQPRVVAVTTSMNIFPKERNFNASGTYLMVNKSIMPIDSLFVKYSGYPTTLALNKPSIVGRDSLYGFDIFGLKDTLMPGDSIELYFTVKNKPNTLIRNNSPIRGNGTKVNNKELYPALGYTTGYELKDNEIRKKYSLPPNPLKPHPSDTTALGNHMMSRDSDWITYEATVSTSVDQIAITPGYLQKEWIEEGRRYFHYKMDIPIMNFYSFSSGRYEVARDTWNDVALEIYYHKGHEYNLDRMMAGMKAGLAYNSENFSPYQFKQVRIIEYPRTLGGGAQGFPNTIPFSEGHGFIADVDDEDDGVDYPFSVTVHEIAHQWWAHQVIGADVLGSSMLTESLSDYVRLKVIEKEQGKSKMRTYLKYSLDGYLRKRGGESRRENPLMYNDGQGYIHYNKGAMVFYALSDYIGEERLNGAIKQYVEEVQFQEPPYTTTIELVDYIREVTPDSLQYIIRDMFETITMYDNSIIDVTSTKLNNGTYQVDIEFNVIKYRNDKKGVHYYGEQVGDTDTISYQSDAMNTPVMSLPLADYIDIGIFGEKDGDVRSDGKSKKNEVELYLRKHKITSINNKVRLIVDQKPIEVGIDPYNKLIDKKSRDNRKKL